MKKLFKILMKIQYIWLFSMSNFALANSLFEAKTDSELTKNVTLMSVGQTFYIDQHAGLLLILMDENNQMIKDYAAQIHCKNRTSHDFNIILTPVLGNNLSDNFLRPGKKIYYLNSNFQDKTNPTIINYSLKNCQKILRKINEFVLNSNEIFKIAIDLSDENHQENLKKTQYSSQSLRQNQYFFLQTPIDVEELNYDNSLGSRIRRFGERYIPRED